MTRIFNIIKQLISFFTFHFIRIGKWFAILFKRNRQLKKISFDYYKNWHFDNSYLAVEMKFKNAIYYKVNGFKSFDFSKQLILDLQEIKTDNIKVEVLGFLQKQVFIIDPNKEFQLNSHPFRTKIENISPVEITRQKIRTKIPNLWLAIDKPKITIPSITVQSNQIAINHKKFNTQDYI